MGQFTEYGRVKFKGKLVALGEEIDEGVGINTGYFIENGEYVPLSTEPDIEYRIVKTFFLYTPAIDFSELKKLSDRIAHEEKEPLGNISIHDYMPNYDDKVAASAIEDMLTRIQKVFPFISAEYIKDRLPDLTLETERNGHSRITAAYFKPGANAFGMCVRNLNDTIGKAYAMHELSHMAGSRVEHDELGEKIFCQRTGFTDEFYNGVGITEGLNEMFSSVARLGDPLSYDQELRLATLLYTTSGSPTEVIKKFYAGDMYYLSRIGYDEETAKRFIKCVDYHTAAYRYDAERSIRIGEKLREKVISETKEQFGKQYLNKEVQKMINQTVAEYVRENVHPEFTESNFISNAQLCILDEFEKSLYDPNTTPDQKVLTIDSAIKCLVFPRDVKEEALSVCPEDFEKTEDKFIEILLDLGIPYEEIAGLFETVYEEQEHVSGESRETVAFDDADLSKIAGELFDARDAERRSDFETNNEFDLDDDNDEGLGE